MEQSADWLRPSFGTRSAAPSESISEKISILLARGGRSAMTVRKALRSKMWHLLH